MVYSASVLAGTGDPGFLNGEGNIATFKAPTGITADESGNIFVSDTGNNALRKISLDGHVTTFAGKGGPGSEDGAGVSASFNSPHGIAFGTDGDVLVADSNNRKIREIDLQGVVTTLVGNDLDNISEESALNSSFKYPYGITVSRSGTVYVSDLYDNSISALSKDGTVKTIVGGESSSGTFKNLTGLAISSDDILFFADSENNVIRSISISCPAGYYRGDSFDKCNICSAGTYSNEGRVLLTR